MADKDTEMTTVSAPAWKWEWNLNTVVILLGFAGSLVAWGATWADVTTQSKANTDGIERLDKRLTAVEVSIRTLDTQELRISAIEKQAGETAVSMRSLEATLSNLSADIRVVREILQRLEGKPRER